MVGKTLEEKIQTSANYYELKQIKRVFQKTREASGIVAPNRRAWHAGCVVGCGLFVHGGTGMMPG